jgi:hypothetical protein
MDRTARGNEHAGGDARHDSVEARDSVIYPDRATDR